MKYPFLVSLLIPLSLASCGVFSSSDDCSDGSDNDGDGLIDSADPGCTLNGDKESPDPVLTACNDTVDNDADGLIDTDDPGCADSLDDDEYNEPISACQDGVDNDEDGLIDFPNDPGCTVSFKDSEEDDCPDGPGCPACANGVDDDEDGLTDYPEDDGCNAAGDSDEFNSDPSICGSAVLIQPLPAGGEVMGVFSGNAANELISDGCGGSGEEHVYVYEPTTAQTLVLTTDFAETAVDTVIYLRSDCRDPDTEYGCNDDAGLGVSTLNVARVEPGTYYIIVDTVSSTTQGHYRLGVTTYTPEKEPCVPAASTCAPGLECRIFVEGGIAAASETCEKPQCSDGEDSDGDGLVDFPEEPGCTDLVDNDETDSCPNGAGCPQCANQGDDDDDTLIDFPADPGCSAASDDFEVDPCIPGVEVIPLGPAGVSGTTSGGSSFDPSCDFGDSGAEDVFQFTLDRTVLSLSFSTEGSSYDTVLSVRLNMCDNAATELDCQDPDTGGEVITLMTPVLGDYYVFVDGASVNGDYVLDVEAILAAGAACTPGEPGFVCTDGFACAVDTCVAAACNDGINNGDGDAVMDYPADPGCESISDNDESDNCPSGAGCPACANAVDDDMDTLIDYPADPGCLAASDNLELDQCIAGVDISNLPEAGVSGTTDPLVDNFDPSCDGFTSGEHIFGYRNTRNLTSLSFSTLGSGGDTVLSVREGDCGNAASEIACADPGAGGEEVTIAAPTADGLFFVFVDTDLSGAADYMLNVSGTISGGAACVQGDAQFACTSGYLCGGGSTCVPTQCNDGINNDADALIDFLDPGCMSLDDNDESDDPNPLPECADGVDNDADTLIDYPADLGCSMAADDNEVDCSDSDPLVAVTTTPITGNTTGTTHDFTPGCRTTSTSPEIVHEITFPGELQSLTVTTDGSGFDTVLYMRAGDCSAVDLVCDDDGGTGLQSLFTQNNVAAGLYFIFVDGYSSAGTSFGAYTLGITGVIKAGQACDMTQISAGILSCFPGTTCTAGTCQ